ncbi:hypothetical protein ACQ4PT_041730 [Festuca glaucescens]
MPRREKSLGVMYIKNKKDRDVTFFKRRGGLFKGAADLSVLTGAKVVVVLERPNGKIHSFGAPSTKPIVDAFLSGAAPTGPFADGATSTRIARLQSEVARLDMENMMAAKRNQLSIKRMMEIQDENPRMVANLVFSKEEDLSLEDLNRLFNGLMQVQGDIRRRLPPLDYGRQANTGGTSMAPNPQPPKGPLLDLFDTTASLMQSSWSHNFPQHQLPFLFPLQSPPEQTLAPLLPIQVPQILQSPPSSFVPQPISFLQPITDALQDLAPSRALHLQNSQDSYNTVQPPQNYTSPNSSVEHSFEATPPLVNVDKFFVDDMFGYDQWGYPLSDHAFNHGLIGMDAYVCYNGIDVSQSPMGDAGQLNASLASSSSGQDVDIHAQYGEFF